MRKAMVGLCLPEPVEQLRCPGRPLQWERVHRIGRNGARPPIGRAVNNNDLQTADSNLSTVSTDYLRKGNALSNKYTHWIKTTPN